MTLDELTKIHQLLNMLRIKTKTDVLYDQVIIGMKIIERELKLKNIESSFDIINGIDSYKIRNK